MKRISIGIIFLFFALSLRAQNETDAFRFSNNNLSSTARFLGLGGAGSTIGADLSAASTNPAGLALYRRAEIMFTPRFLLTSNQADFLDANDISGRNSTFGISNAGFTFTGPVKRFGQPAEKGLKSYTFAFGLNQLQNYSQSTQATGFNNFSSITDRFVELGNGTPYNNLDPDSYAGLAWNNFLIDTLAGSSSAYFPAVNGGRIQQTVSLNEEGRNQEWFISLAGNVDDFLYAGVTLGIRNLKYSQTLIVKEEDTRMLHEFYQNDPAFTLEFPTEKLSVTDRFNSEGTGINARFGIIVRPADQLRIGINFETPSLYSLTDEFQTSMEHTVELAMDQTQDLSGENTPGLFDYNLTTPYSAGLGLTYLFGKSGFLTADVKVTDYTAAKFSSPYTITDPAYYAFSDENQRISEAFRMAVNYSIGGEYRMDIYRVRAGFAWQTSGLKPEFSNYQDPSDPANLLSVNPDTRIISFGTGIRQPNYFLDVVYVNQFRRERFNPYSLEAPGAFSPSIINKVSRHIVALSLGFNI